MDSIKTWIGPEDYQEPVCVLCMDPSAHMKVPQDRIIQKLDEYMSKRDFPAAERHLLYWLKEAELGKDERGELMLRNELVGYYRKMSDRDHAIRSGEKALSLIEKLGFGNTISAGTTYVNCATAYNAFGDNEKALELFKKAKSIYESSEFKKPELLGGLYNNMALTYVALNQFREAQGLFQKAIEEMRNVENGEPEQAITYLNMANAVEKEIGMEAGEETIFDCLDKAQVLLDTPSVPRNGYYAFVCEKCAPTFGYYGYFVFCNILEQRAREIYERA